MCVRERRKKHSLCRVAARRRLTELAYHPNSASKCLSAASSAACLGNGVQSPPMSRQGELFNPTEDHARSGDAQHLETIVETVAPLDRFEAGERGDVRQGRSEQRGGREQDRPCRMASRARPERVRGGWGRRSNGRSAGGLRLQAAFE